VAPLPTVMTESQLDGYERNMTYTDIGGTDYLETITITKDLIVNGVITPATYVQTFTYGGPNGTGVINISEWVLQP